MKEEYIKFVILQSISQMNFGSELKGSWMDGVEYSAIKSDIGASAFAPYGIRVTQEYDAVTASIFQTLKTNHGVLQTGDKYTGYWYKLNPPKILEITRAMLSDNPASKRLKALPDVALTRALSLIAQEDGLSFCNDDGFSDVIDSQELNQELGVPASDRVVRLSHNQQNSIEKPLEALTGMLEQENSIDGVDGFRELIVGRLRAGHELIKAGVFTLRSLQLTLIIGLRMLVEKYEKTAIGIAATMLLDLLLKQYGIG